MPVGLVIGLPLGAGGVLAGGISLLTGLDLLGAAQAVGIAGVAFLAAGCFHSVLDLGTACVVGGIHGSLDVGQGQLALVIAIVLAGAQTCGAGPVFHIAAGGAGCLHRCVVGDAGVDMVQLGTFGILVALVAADGAFLMLQTGGGFGGCLVDFPLISMVSLVDHGAAILGGTDMPVGLVIALPRGAGGVLVVGINLLAGCNQLGTTQAVGIAGVAFLAAGFLGGVLDFGAAGVVGGIHGGLNGAQRLLALVIRVVLARADAAGAGPVFHIAAGGAGCLYRSVVGNAGMYVIPLGNFGVLVALVAADGTLLMLQTGGSFGGCLVGLPLEVMISLVHLGIAALGGTDMPVGLVIGLPRGAAGVGQLIAVRLTADGTNRLVLTGGSAAGMAGQGQGLLRHGGNGGLVRRQHHAAVVAGPVLVVAGHLAGGGLGGGLGQRTVGAGDGNGAALADRTGGGGNHRGTGLMGGNLAVADGCHGSIAGGPDHGIGGIGGLHVHGQVGGVVAVQLQRQGFGADGDACCGVDNGNGAADGDLTHGIGIVLQQNGAIDAIGKVRLTGGKLGHGEGQLGNVAVQVLCLAGGPDTLVAAEVLQHFVAAQPGGLCGIQLQVTADGHTDGVCLVKFGNGDRQIDGAAGGAGNASQGSAAGSQYGHYHQSQTEDEGQPNQKCSFHAFSPH